MSDRYPDWAKEGKDWPNRGASRFVNSGSYRWHVQISGSGPVCLLLHGTGAATHSWRDLIPILAESFQVVAVDLPGHGFTRGTGRRPTLEAMSAALHNLLAELNLTPELIVGHSAGVAIGAQLLLDGEFTAPMVGFTPALMPFPGLAARIFPSLAKLLFTNPFVSIIFAQFARRPGETAKFLRRATGSDIDAPGERYYALLFGKSGHCDGAIRMMANWKLEPLQERLGEIEVPVLLVHAEKDVAIPKSAVTGSVSRFPNAEIQEMLRVGHLAHEEDPLQAAGIVTEFAKRHRPE